MLTYAGRAAPAGVGAQAARSYPPPRRRSTSARHWDRLIYNHSNSDVDYDELRTPHGEDSMSEEAVITRTPTPGTITSLAGDLRLLGVEPGMALLVNCSLSAVGWGCGGPVAVARA